jgi:hypothetical protein
MYDSARYLPASGSIVFDVETEKGDTSALAKSREITLN